ncbi:MAG: ribonuclease HI [Magnetococcales bacterium]|nr:ribonuclease HI [Magnetococcales bacterium]
MIHSESTTDRRPRVDIHTDGACRGNPGPGGWGVVLRHGPHARQLFGFAAHTTNNRMEMLATIHALVTLKKSCQVRLVTDSTYVKDGITRWIHAWKAHQWHKKDGKAVRNADLWQRLDLLAGQHTVRWEWIKGHAGHPDNELADQLARQAIDMGLKGELPSDPDGASPDSPHTTDRFSLTGIHT